MECHPKSRGWIDGYNVEYLELYSTFAMLSIRIAIFFFQIEWILKGNKPMKEYTHDICWLERFICLFYICTHISKMYHVMEWI